MKALKGSAEERALLQRYTKELDGQEDRLATIRKTVGELRDKRTQTNSELERLVFAVTIDPQHPAVSGQ